MRRVAGRIVKGAVTTRARLPEGARVMTWDARRAGLTDDAWAELCAITMLPQVTHIVPTFAG